jgi:hypothetical protein
MPKALNLTGEKFGKLTVVKRTQNSQNGHSNWLCQCDCGNYKVVNSGQLRKRNGTRSCGCLRKKIGDRTRTHGMTKTRLYSVWDKIKRRCLLENEPEFFQYGGRGIKVCNDWLGEEGFINFYNWAIANGYNEDASRGECTIDRIDVNGNYEPSNCRWVDMKKQSRNKRNTFYVFVDGKKVSLSEICEQKGIDFRKMAKRIRLGKNFEEAIIDIDKDLRLKNGKKENLLS